MKGKKIFAGIINTIFKASNVQKHTRLKIYNTLALLVLLYGSKGQMIAKEKTELQLLK
jgi:hypothetical protein